MTLLETARKHDETYGRPAREPPAPVFTAEHYELAAAFLRGELTSTAFRTAVKITRGNPESWAYRMLREGARNGAITLLLGPAVNF